MRKSAYIIFLLAMLLPLGAWAWSGSGTFSSPYIISSAADLQKFANIVNGANGETRNVAAWGKLTADINLNNAAWKAMGSSSYAYTGTFDGQGHKISGLSLTATAANAGLFGYVNNATIQNFTLAGSISSGYDNTGSVVGYAKGNSSIKDIVSTVNITMTAAKSHLGGIAGNIEDNTSVLGCTYSGTLNAGNSTDTNGGIVGFANANCSGTIKYCFFNGTVKTTGSSPQMGGILGYTNDESKNFGGVQNCYSCGTLTFAGSDTHVNAIVGRFRAQATTTINNTYLSGTATRACNTDGPSIPTSNTAITISVTAGSNGTVSKSYVNPTSTTATKLHVEATPNTGYHFTKWSDNGAQAHDVALTNNVSLTASFAAHTYGDWITDKAATCTASGTKHRVCTHTGCDAREDGTIPALGHGTTGYTPTYTWGGTYSAATCTFTLKCNKCSSNVVSNQSLTTSKVSASHKDATCTAAGNERWTATGNYNKSGDATYSGTAQNNDYAIPALGHNFTSQTATDTYLKSAATCTADAVYYHKCSRCTTKGTTTWTNTGTATGHGHTKGYTPTYTWSDDIDVHTCSFTLKCLDCNANVVSNSSLTGAETAHTDATCTADGSTTYQATGSYSATKSVAYNENNSKTYTIDALGHDMTEHAHVPATCTETGMDAYWTCSRCEGKLFKDENGSAEWSGMPVLAALGHDISNNQCSRCDLKAKAVFANNTLTFYFDDIEHDGTTYSLNTGSSDPGWLEKRMDISTVVFDSSFGSARPTTCYKWFYNSQWLSKITGLEYLNTEEVTNMNRMFYYCRFLRSLDLSGFNTSKVSDMEFMFNSCRYLESLDLSSFNTSITTTMSVMFANCNTLNSLTIGNFDMSLVTSSGDMFYDCNNLKTLTLKSVPFLKEGTFDTWFSGDGKTVNLLLDENSVIYEGTNYLPTITNCNHYNQTTPVHVDATCTEDGYDGKTCSYCHTDFDKTINSPALPHTFAAEDHNESVCTVCNHGFFRYTSGNGEVVTPKSSNNLLGADGVKANILSNTYANGQGVIEFDKPLVTIGESAFSRCGFTGDLAIPNSVTTIGNYAFYYCSSFNGTLTLGSSIKTIGDNAFQQCGFTGNLVIPNSVTTIGNYAFNNCYSFNGTLTLGNTVETIGTGAFYKCSGFTGTLTLGNTVETIGDNAFRDCSGFTGALVIPNSVITIGNYAFYRCSGFTGALVIPNTVTTIGDHAFHGCLGFNGTLTLGSSVEIIGNNAFRYCPGFTGNLIVPNSVTTIGEFAFGECSSFNGTLTLGSSVETIGNYAFGDCSGFNGTLTLGSSVQTIGEGAFFNCKSFTGDLVIPNSVTTIGNSAFYNCTGFNGTLTLGSSVETIGNDAFYYCSGFNGTLTLGSSVQTIGEFAFGECTGFTGNLVIPNSVTTIGNYAFDDCSGFNGTLTLGSSVGIIGNSAFRYCSGFTGSLVIPNSVTTIGNSAFYNCTGFNGTLTLGSSVQTIGEEVFFSCSGFNGTLTLGSSIQTIGTRAFENCTSFNSVELHSIPYTDWSFYGVTDNKTVVLNGNSYVYKGENPDFPEVLSVTAPCTLDLTGSVVENHANLTINHSSGTTMTAAPVEDGLYAYVCDNGCGGHSGDHIIKDFNGPGNHLALTKDAEGHYSTTENIKIIDATAFVSPVEFTAQSVEYTRTFGGTNWTTWYVPFDLELTDEICQMMDFSRINNVHQYDDDEDGIADRTEIESFRQHTGVTLKANYPYLVRAKEDTDLNIELALGNATVAAKDENSIVCRSVDYTYTFTGTYQGEGDSGLNSDSPFSLFDDVSDNCWYHFQNLAPQRHYMVITPRNGGVAPHHAKVMLRIIGEEDVTGIVTIYSGEQQCDGTYDLMGRKINSNSKQPGLRIVNGKKYFLK